MDWLRRFFARRREAQARRAIGTLFEKHGLEVVPEFPDFVNWLENASLHEAAKKLARVLANDPDFPKGGPYSSIRAYFDNILRDDPESNDMLGQLAQTWLMERANRKTIQVRDAYA